MTSYREPRSPKPWLWFCIRSSGEDGCSGGYLAIARPRILEFAAYAKMDSDPNVGNSGDGIVIEERRPIGAQTVTSDPFHTTATTGDDQGEGSMGAWSDDKPGIRRDGSKLACRRPKPRGDQQATPNQQDDGTES